MSMRINKKTSRLLLFCVAAALHQTQPEVLLSPHEKVCAAVPLTTLNVIVSSASL